MIVIVCCFFCVQQHIGEFLGIPCNRVNVRVKRIGKLTVEIPNNVSETSSNNLLVLLLLVFHAYVFYFKVVRLVERLLTWFHRLALHPLPHGSKNYSYL